MRGKWQQRRCIIVIGLMFVWVLGGCASHGEESVRLKEVSALEATGEASQEAGMTAGAAKRTEGVQETAVPDGAQAEGMQDTEEERIYVYVCGYVHVPGVYELDPDSRLYEAIEAAGGMTEAAAPSWLNQAERLSDGQKVYVPSVEETGHTGGMPADASEDAKTVNLNTATKEELMTLSGIGDVKAQAIIRYREERGGFTDIEQLKEIEGIKDGVYNKIKEKIRI